MKNCMLVILLLLSGNAIAANKWVDAEGRVHYSDQQPPEDAKSLTMKFATQPVTPTASPTPASGVVGNAKAAGKEGGTNDQAAKKAAAEKAAQEAASKAQNQANCQTAKQNLANLKDGMRIAIVDPNTGEHSFLDDAQRQKSTDEAQQQISKFCQ